MNGAELKLDIAANRRARKYSRWELAGRGLWGAGGWLVRLSPHGCYGWRRWVLRCFGARLGREARVSGSSRIYLPWNLELGAWSAIGEEVLVYNLGRVRIGERVTVSHRAHLCAGTHDYERVELPLVKAGIEIGDDAWVCTEAFVGPGVRVGEGAVVGARAVVVKDVPAWSVVAGNPARVVKERRLRDGAELRTSNVQRPSQKGD